MSADLCSRLLVRAVLATVFFFVGALSITAAPSVPPPSEAIAIVVAGDPSKTGTVVDVLSPWLTERGRIGRTDAIPDSSAREIAACYLKNDRNCAAPWVAKAKDVSRTIFIMIELAGDEGSSQWSLTGWLLSKDGKVTAADRRYCETCRIDKLAETTVALARALFGEADPAPATSKGTLEIRSTPSGATIKVDGKKVGTTPMDIEVAAGDHTVEFTAKGVIAVHQQVTAGVGTRTPVNVTLATAPTKPSRALLYGGLATGSALILTGAVLVGFDASAGDRNTEFVTDTTPATIALVATGAAVIGTTLYLHHRRKAKSQLVLAPGLSSHPLVGRGASTRELSAWLTLSGDL